MCVCVCVRVCACVCRLSFRRPASTLPAKWLFFSLHVMRRRAASAHSTAYEQL